MDAKRKERLEFAVNQARLNTKMPIAGANSIAAIVKDRFGTPLTRQDIDVIRKRIRRTSATVTMRGAQGHGETDRIRQLLSDGKARSVNEVTIATGIDLYRTGTLLPDMAKRGTVTRTTPGVYQMTEEQCCIAKVWRPGMTVERARAFLKTLPKVEQPKSTRRLVQRAKHGGVEPTKAAHGSNGQWQVSYSDPGPKASAPATDDLPGWLAFEQAAIADVETATQRLDMAKSKVREKLQQALAERA